MFINHEHWDHRTCVLYINAIRLNKRHAKYGTFIHIASKLHNLAAISVENDCLFSPCVCALQEIIDVHVSNS